MLVEVPEPHQSEMKILEAQIKAAESNAATAQVILQERQTTGRLLSLQAALAAGVDYKTAVLQYEQGTFSFKLPDLPEKKNDDSKPVRDSEE